jgi:hypothetical protein
VGGYSTRCTDSAAQFHWAWTRELAGLRLEERSKPRFTLRSVGARGRDYWATDQGSTWLLPHTFSLVAGSRAAIQRRAPGERTGRHGGVAQQARGKWRSLLTCGDGDS